MFEFCPLWPDKQLRLDWIKSVVFVFALYIYRFSTFTKTGGDAFLMGQTNDTVPDADKIKIVVSKILIVLHVWKSYLSWICLKPVHCWSEKYAFRTVLHLNEKYKNPGKIYNIHLYNTYHLNMQIGAVFTFSIWEDYRATYCRFFHNNLKV